MIVAGLHHVARGDLDIFSSRPSPRIMPWLVRLA